MSDAAFLARLSEAIQRQHEATMVLQQLASELVDHTVRMRAFTDKLHAMRGAAQPAGAEMLAEPQELSSVPITYPSSAMDISHMPTVLRSGPVRGER